MENPSRALYNDAALVVVVFAIERLRRISERRWDYTKWTVVAGHMPDMFELYRWDKALRAKQAAEAERLRVLEEEARKLAEVDAGPPEPGVAPGQVWESLDPRAPRLVRVAAITTDDDGLDTRHALIEDLISGRMSRLPVRIFSGAGKGFRFYEMLPTTE
jgi:hypothetical protein